MSEEEKKHIKKLKEEIEINKNNAIKEITEETMVPAMWSVSRLIDLKAQLSILEKIEGGKL